MTDKPEEKRKALILGILVGVLITPVAAIVSVASGGAGHGTYVGARLLFPYTMLLTLMSSNRISLPLMLLALAQFPLYGGIVGRCKERGWARSATVLLLGVHVIAAAVCFSGVLPNFS